MNAALMFRLAAGVSLAALFAGEAAAQYLTSPYLYDSPVTGSPNPGKKGTDSQSNTAPTSGGAGGAVEAATYSSTTSASSGSGIYVTRNGGGGGAGGNNYHSKYTGTSGGAGMSGGAVTITYGNASSTMNLSGSGIVALSAGGSGGKGGDTYSKVGGNGGAAGAGGAVTVSNYGTISTSGDIAYGLYASSAGGAGGNGGYSTEPYDFYPGGNGGAGGDGGSVTVTNANSVATAGSGATGILAISLGGKGGAANSNNMKDYGTPGANAVGGAVLIANSASVTTSAGHGVHGLSIGGGASGGTVTINNSGSISAGGAGYIALMALSAAPDGGDRSFSGLSSLGSASGSAPGSVVTVTSSSTIAATGQYGVGLFAASIGAGGGPGGMTSGASRVGATGSASGSGGAVNVTTTAAICTGGSCGAAAYSGGAGRAAGLVALSLGGGGGLASYGVNSVFSGSIALGGAGAGGDGGATLVNAAGGVTTRENNSPAKSAGSVGGGGGLALGQVTITASSYTPTITLGATSASAGAGGAVGLNCGTTLSATLSACAGAPARASAVPGASTTTTSAGASSPALVAYSVGGGGGLAAVSMTVAESVASTVTHELGAAGAIGAGGAVYAAQYGGSVTTTGVNSPGILALSVGSGGGLVGSVMNTSRTSGDTTNATISLKMGSTGSSSGGAVTVETSSTSSFTTSNTHSHGVVGLSVGGGGGVLGFNGIANYTRFLTSLQVGGASTGAGGTVDVSNASGISTSGANSYGVFAASVGGGGGLGSYSVTTTATLGAATGMTVGGVNGSSSAVTLVNQANVTVSGAGGGGLAAMSIAGGGGSGGAVYTSGSQTLDSAFRNRLAGSATVANTSGNVTLSNSGLVSVAPGKAQRATPAILAMSVAGGGGRSSVVGYGSLSGSGTLNEEVGATTSVAGTAGALSVTNGAGAGASTAGDLSPGIVGMSVAGEGGFGGIAMNGAVDSVALGNVRVGTGAGAGGRSGEVAIVNDGSISTNGYGSTGLMAQSIGGSGGYGGWAFNDIAKEGADTFSILLGGAGGTLGVSGLAKVSGASTGSISTGKFISPGALAQSIGGSGGFAFAGFATGLTTVSPTITLGGSGAANTTASAAQINLQGSVSTVGMLSPGALAQSLGGNGGFAAYAFNGGNSVKAPIASINLGGSVGSVQRAGSASASMSGSITTQGVGSHALAAQSIGGGGGFGGEAWSMSSVDPDNTEQLVQNYRLGSISGGGGRGDAAAATLVGNVTTSGWGSAGVSAQSVGNGGGEAFGYSNNTTGSIHSSSLALGGNAASSDGGAGSATVSINSGNADKRVSTSGHHSQGVFAQSVGAGGGRAVSIVRQTDASGGFGADAEMGSFGDPVGGSSGVVSVTTQGSVVTSGNDSGAVFAQSLGGGGGYGAASFFVSNAASSASTPSNQQALAGSGSGSSSKARSGYDAVRPSSQVSVSSTRGAVVGATLGGFGFQVSSSGTVTVANGAANSTGGALSDGVEAQSIGGGGGRFSLADVNSSSSLSGALTLGGGGSGGHGSTVSVTTTGSMNIGGNGSHGVFAQSVGGGGGDARLWQSTSKFGGTSAVSIDHGMVAGASSIAGGGVTVTNSGQIALGGAASNGLFAQSVGGGGGYSSSIQTNTAAYAWTRSSTLSRASAQAGVLANVSVSSSANNAASGAEGGTMMGAQTSANGGNALALTLGSAAGTSGNGAAVSVTNQAAIGRMQDKTIGDASSVILAQSIGAGGGASQHYARNMDEQQSSIAFTLGGSGTAGGDAGAVTVTNNTTDATKFLGASGPAAMGIVAQSVSGGGGVALSSRSTTLGGGSLAAALTLGASTAVAGSAGEARVTTGGSITTGTGAPAVVAQSISSGGGVAKVFATAADNGTSYSTSAGTATASSGATSATTSSGLAAAISLGSWSGVSPYDVGEVTVSSSSTINTNGLRSIGVVAQAVVGGGGLADVIANGPNGGNFAGAFSFGGRVYDITMPELKVTSSGAITTVGGLSHGVVAQSINLGGGVAGAATLGNTKSAGATTLQAQLGAVSTASPPQSPLSGKVKVEVSNTISTGGDGSSGVVAQSISGGGGLLDVSLRAGSGSSTSMQSIAFGGTSPGVGLNVEIDDTAATNSVSTAGFFSHGLVAQSVGQGGGLAMGLVSRGAGESSFNLNVATTSKTGGLIDTAGDGASKQDGSVAVSNKGAITTAGALSAGVLAQAVTSGGASGVLAKIASSGSISTTYAIGGATDTVTFADYAKVTNSGAISTSGDYAAGLVAQSIPHGGLHGFVGDLVSSVASSTLTATLGASAETSTNYVAVSNAGAISTQGFGAVGVLAQAIGGGGGALFHKAGATSVNVTLGGSAPSAYGSEWTSNDQTYRVNVSTAGVTTTGDFAAGVIAQAIGGGGGVAGWAGSPTGSVRLGARQSSDETQSVGAGSGDKVNVSVSGAISTTGLGAIGVIAQSIGGGGGATLGRAATAQLGSAALSAANEADGKDVTVTLNAAVTTSGAGAVGVLAQSIGGGGGVAFVTGTGSFGPSTPIVAGPVSPTPSADAGKVTVNVNKDITVSGVGSAGVVAQSIGGGGGLLLNPDGALTSAATATPGFGDGKDVIVNIQNATVRAHGDYSVGVVGTSIGGGGGVVLTGVAEAGSPVLGGGEGSIGAQPSPSSPQSTKAGVKQSNVIADGVGGQAFLINGSEIDIDSGSIVMGGTGSGAGIAFSGAHVHEVRNAGFLGSRNPLDGNAVTSSAGVTTISNSGVMQGSMRLAPGANSVTNLSGGAYLMGATVDLGGGRLSNDGLLSASAPVTRISGDVTQSASGRLRVLSDLAGGTGSQVQIAGAARLGGQVAPVFQNGGRLRSGTYSMQNVVAASNGVTLDPGFTMGQTALVTSTARLGANGVSFESVVNFTPAGLSPVGQAIGRAVDQVQAQGGSALFSPILDHLVNVASVGDLERAYGAMTSRAVANAQQAALDGARRTTEAFADRADLWRRGGLGEQGWRAWATPLASYSTASRDGHSIDTRSFAGVAGLDMDVNRDAMLGFGAALGQSRFSYGDKASGRQDFGGAALYGAWRRDGLYVSGVGYVGAMRSDLSRSFGPLESFANAQLSLDGTLVAGRLEVGRTFGFGAIEATPFAAIAPAVLMQKAATETVTINATGAAHPGMRYLSQEARALPSFLGVQFGMKRALSDGGQFAADLRLAWRHEFLDTRKVSQELALAPGVGFTRETKIAAKDALDVKLRADWTMTNGVRVFGEVGASLAPNANSVTARGGVQVAW